MPFANMDLHPDDSQLWAIFAERYELTVDLARQVFALWDVNTHSTFAAHLASLEEE